MIKINRVVNLTILLYMISTMLLNIISRSLPVNKILGALLFIELVYCIIKRSRKREVLLVLMAIISAAMACINSSNINVHLSDSIYFVVTILLYMVLNNDKFEKDTIEFFIKPEVVILIKMMIVIVGISLFLPMCYAQEWGNGRYYIGFTAAAHTVASNMCLLMSLFLVSQLKNKTSFWNVFWLLPPAYAILESGARVFLAPLVIILFMFFKENVKRNQIKLLVYPLGVSVAVYVLLRSNMMSKLLFVANNQWGGQGIESFTNGRTSFWIGDLINYHTQYGIIEKIVGKGFDNVYWINKQIHGTQIWAHNDIIHVLLGTGIIGLLVLLVSWNGLIKSVKKRVNYVRIYIVMMTMYIFVSGMINGTIIYIHYTASIVMLTIYIGTITNKREAR